MTTTIITLGPIYSYSDIAAKQFAEKNIKSSDIVYYSSIEAIVSAISEQKSGRQAIGVVPLFNNSSGWVLDSANHIKKLSKNINVISVVSLEIQHCLCTKINQHPKRVIKKIYSHPQAFKQCEPYLSAHFPLAQRVASSSTAEAAKKVSESKSDSVAAICSLEAAINNNLQVVDTKIASSKQNKTSFAVIEFSETPITSLV